MKTTKRLFAVLLCIAMLLSVMILPAHAGGDEMQVLDGRVTLSIEQVTEPKGAMGTAELTLGVRNDTDTPIRDLQVDVESDDVVFRYMTGVNFASVEPGYPDEITFRMQLSPRAQGLGFLARLLLTLRSFFTGKNSYYAPVTDRDGGVFTYSFYFGDHQADVNFYISGGYDAPNTPDTPETPDMPELTDDSLDAIVAYYNEALRRSRNTRCSQKMELVEGSLGGDGAIGVILKVLEPAAISALEKNSHDRSSLPGDPDHYPLQAADVRNASWTSDGRVTTMELVLKDQSDGPNGDAANGGPVARGVGTLGSVDNALNELGASITEGRDTIRLTYNNAYIRVRIDENTGKILSGTWHNMTNINIGEAKVKLGISATLKNFRGQVEYTVTL